MKIILSVLVALSVVAGMSLAPASATFTGSKNASDIFKKIERNLP